ncbi:MAG: amidohydrolase family protein [Luteitalea sp.]|nr:amidohydrolase family protein [Luteitalea sp.]
MMRTVVVMTLSLLGALTLEGTPVMPIAITNVTVVNPCRDAGDAGQTVIVEDGYIRAIQAASVPLPSGARRIDGARKFLIPGLWDAHVHLTKGGLNTLPLYIANGVTAVRDMGSDLQEVQAWRAQIEAGALVGPRIKTAGPMLESPANVERMKQQQTIEPIDRLRVSVGGPNEAREVVNRLAAAGADLIKVRTTQNPSTFRAIADAAKRQGLPLAAHPFAPPEDLRQDAVRSIEHFVAYPPLNDRTAVQRRALFANLAHAGLFMSTTLANVDQSLLVPHDESVRRLQDRKGMLDSRRKYACGYLVEDWREQVDEKKDEPIGPFRVLLPGFFRDLRELRDARVRFLAGTDVGVAFMYPGFSLHDELEILVRRVGFRPMEALRIATRHAPMFFGIDRTMGCVEPGHVADLVLLDANPLSDIVNTRKIRGVMTTGHWFDRAALDRLLSGVEQACLQPARQTPNAR